MKAEIIAFPWATPQGFPVLHIDFEGAPFDTEKVKSERDRFAGAKGLWATWLDGVESWESPELDGWLDDKVIAVRPLDALDWPAAECMTILDISSVSEHMDTVEALSARVSKYVATCPAVEDVILRLSLGQRPPMTAALDLLDDFVGTRGINYLYAPALHVGFPLMLRAVARAGSAWALRSLP